MAKVSKEPKIESKKLDDYKDTPENKKALAEADGKKLISDESKADEKVVTSDESKADEEIIDKKKENKETKPAVEKAIQAKPKKEAVVEFEREYVVPLRMGFLNVPKYRRAKKAVRVLKEFIVRHMKIRDRDLNKVKVDINLNNEIWFRGIKKPMNKIKVKALKKADGTVEVKLADVPKTVEYKIKRLEKRKAAAVQAKPKETKKESSDKNKDGVDDKFEEKEDVKAEAELDKKINKEIARADKHSTKGAHRQKTSPVMSNPKK